MRIGEDPAVDIWIADVSDLALDKNIYMWEFFMVYNMHTEWWVMFVQYL